MVALVNELKEVMGEVKETCINSMMNEDIVMAMDENTLKMVQSSLKLLDISERMIIKQATMMEDQDRRLRLILSKLENMEKKESKAH